jgi:endogenous inhibitor of DNA gyrase (YacG/DUF329 family)
MIPMIWYGISVDCPDCKGTTILKSAEFSADNEWRWFFWCPICEKPVEWRVFQSQLAAQATASDFEKWLAKRSTAHLDRAIGKEIARISAPVRPPLSPKLDLTPQDIRDLKALGILIQPDDSKEPS